MGKKGGEQPQRALYLRTLANLTSPSEVWSVLQIAKTDVETTNITSDLLALQKQDKWFDNATDKTTNKIKNKFMSFCSDLKRSTAEVMRILARIETQHPESDIKGFLDEFTAQLSAWQSRK